MENELRKAQLWRLLKESAFENEVITTIQTYDKDYESRHPNGCHVVQFAMLHSPFFVDTILSIDEKALALSSTPDEHGRMPFIYWIASGRAQDFVQETAKTTLIIPKQIDEEAWRQSAELAYELEIDWIGLFSNKVQRKFESTTGKKLDEWIEEEAANGNPWFERMVDLAVKSGKKRKYNKTLNEIQFTSSDIINDIWSDPDNHRVVNTAHALFRAHLMCKKFVSFSVFYDINEAVQNAQKKLAQKTAYFIKTHLVGEAFNNFKNQINDGISFMKDTQCKVLAESQWWGKLCATIEREQLMDKHKVTDTIINNKFNAI